MKWVSSVFEKKIGMCKVLADCMNQIGMLLILQQLFRGHGHSPQEFHKGANYPHEEMIKY